MFRFLRRDEPAGEAARAALLRILELNKELARASRPETLTERILDAAIELVGAERGFLIRSGDFVAEAPAGPPAAGGAPGEAPSAPGAAPEGDAPRWEVVAARNIDRENVRRALKKVSRSITTQVLESGEPFRSADAVNDEALLPAASVTELKLRSVLCVPLRLERVVGCLYVDNRFAQGLFGEGAQELLEAFADQAVLAMERVRLLDENEGVRRRLEEANARLQSELRDRAAALESLSRSIGPAPANLCHEYPTLVGRGRAMTAMLGVVDRVLGGDFPVLLVGESGTGKELVARAVHTHGPRADRPFVGVNCGAIAEGLLESELFGAVKGAYTGAHRDRRGLVEAATGGVLFLDEIGEMSLALQAKLLRVLQEKTVRPVGGNEEVSVDVRVVSATHRDLAREVERGHFREDLYYRLKVVQIDVPPLRERREDVPELVEVFLRRAAEKSGRPPPRVTPGCLERLVQHDWPGNVRELENEVTRMVALGGEELGPDLVAHLARSPRTAPVDVGGLVGRRLADVEADLIRATLAATGGKRGEAARMLGIPRRTFYNRLKALGIE